jgi:hypothetical protein
MRDPIDFNSADITAPRLYCETCGREWRAPQIEHCKDCARSIGFPIQLNETQGEELMRLVQLAGHNSYEDEDDDEYIIFLLKEMPWYDAEDVWQAQACYLYLSYQEEAPDVAHMMDFFKTYFLNSVPYVKTLKEQYA